MDNAGNSVLCFHLSYWLTGLFGWITSSLSDSVSSPIHWGNNDNYPLLQSLYGLKAVNIPCTQQSTQACLLLATGVCKTLDKLCAFLNWNCHICVTGELYYLQSYSQKIQKKYFKSLSPHFLRSWWNSCISDASERLQF